MQNDPNRYGSPSTSQKCISKLKIEEINDENKENCINQECSVCKQNYKIEDKDISCNVNIISTKTVFYLVKRT